MKEMLTPTDENATKKPREIFGFDFTINLPMIGAVLVMLFGAAVGVAKMETKSDHDADLQRIRSEFVRQDVNAATTKELDEWRIEIRNILKEHSDQMDRIEKKLDRQR
jgi:hypothetical protein